MTQPTNLTNTTFPGLIAAHERIALASRNDHKPERTELALCLMTRSAEGAPPSDPYLYPPPSVPILQAVDGKSFPKGIQDAISSAICDVQMGIFVEISRVWVAIDNKLYLWNYYSNDYTMFGELDQLIISVGLCKPKPNSLSPAPSYILVITTLIQVVLVGVTVSATSLELRHTKISAVTDGVPMRAVAGTPDGRIFLAGNDGGLYELMYEAPSLLHTLGVKRQCFTVGRGSGLSASLGWLVPSFIKSLAGTDPLVALEIDARRQLMYTLSKAGSICGYSLEPSSSQLRQFASVHKLGQTLKAFLDDPRNHRVTAVGVQKHDLVDIDPVSLDVVAGSYFVHLVVTTSRGLRIFFTTSDGVPATPSRSAGKHLKVVCLRGPPLKERLNEVRSQPAKPEPQPVAAGPSTSAPVTRASRSLGGVSLLAYTAATAAQGPLKDTLMALHTDLSMPGGGGNKWQPGVFCEAVEMLGNAVTGHPWCVCEEPDASSLPQTDEFVPNELVVQHLLPRRRFLVLTSTGLFVLVKNRPLNVLHSLLERGELDLAKLALRRAGLDEGCAMALALACSSEEEAGARAALLLQREGYGEQGKRLPAFASEQALAQAAPLSNLRGNVLAPSLLLQQPDGDVVFSGCFEGLVLRLARLLRPLWDQALVEPATGRFRLPRAQLARLREPLVLLAEFMQSQPPFRDAVQAALASRRLEELQQRPAGLGRSPTAVEAYNTFHVFSLCSQAVQATGLVHELMHELGEASVLGKATWADVIATPEGRQAVRQLVRAAVDKGLRDVDALQQVAPDFVSDGDAMQVAVRAELQAAKAQAGERRDVHVGRALALLEQSFDRSLQSAGRPQPWRVEAALERLDEASRLLCELDRRAQAVALCLGLAARCAKGALDVLPPGDDVQADETLAWRARCYDMVFAALQTNDARAVAAALESNDALWHFALYKSLLSQGQLERLTKLHTPFIEAFLTNPQACVLAPSKHQDENLELYARWLASKKALAPAAKVLLGLARLNKVPRPPSIDDRVGYLARALAFTTASVEAMGLAHEIQDELDMCQLQQGVARALQGKAPEAEAALQRELVRPTRLYSDFAVVYELWEECIAIMHVCRFDDDPGELWRMYEKLLQPEVNAWNINGMSAVVRRLAMRFSEPDRESFAFPLDELVACLEAAAFVRERLGIEAKLRTQSGLGRESLIKGLTWPNEWLVRALTDARVPFWRVFVAYARLQNSGCGGDARRSLYAAKALQVTAHLWIEKPIDNLALFERWVNHAMPLSLEMGGAANILERTVFAVQDLEVGLITRAEKAAVVDEVKKTLTRILEVARGEV